MVDFDKLAASTKIEDKIKAAQDPECPAEVLDKIVLAGDINWGSSESNELINTIVSNPNCPPEHLSTIYENPTDDGQRLLVLQNPSCPRELMNKAVEGDDVNLKQAVLKNSTLSADVVLGCVKSESIGSELIIAISERNELDDITREIIDLKVKLAELREQHQDDSGYAWLEESLLSITDWGKDVFEAIYRDNNAHIRLAVAKNPSLPEEMLSELIEDSESSVKLSALANPSCTKTILKKASEDTENYSSSRVRKAVALNTKTPKAVLNKLLKDEYRWVREAAASHHSINKTAIKKLITTGDRYILKGLVVNPNCDKTDQKKINKLIEDEEKYPVQKDTYIIGFDCNCYPSEEVAGEIPLDDIVDAIIGGYESWSNFVWDNNWYDYDDYYHAYGMRDTATNIEYPDGAMESINIKEPEDYESFDIESCASDVKGTFVAEGTSYEKAYGGWENWMKYSIELEYELIPDNIVPTYECGMVDGYNYDDEYFESDDMYSTSGKGSDFSLYIVTKNGLESIDLDEIIEGINEQGLDPENEADVRKYIEKNI
jgi:hypothetical protein